MASTSTLSERLDVPVEETRVAGATVAPAEASGVQLTWATTPIIERLQIIRKLRHRLASDSHALLEAFSPTLARTRADSLIAEVLPLLEACRFLEQRAADVLAPRQLGRSGRPLWLAGVDSTVERVPLGTVLLVAPFNYPLLLPGVQALQALAAGNGVVWKPGRGGARVAHQFAAMLAGAGLPHGLLRVTDESVATVAIEVNARPDKIFFTGSAQAGRVVARMAAEHVIPMVAELSGADAVVALPSADIARLADALTFGLRLNGSATCMAPRRLFLLGQSMQHEALLDGLQTRFAATRGIVLAPATRHLLQELAAQAEAAGATILGDINATELRPILVLNAQPTMRMAQTDLFAPVLSVLRVPTEAALLAADKLCPFGLTVSVWGERRAAESLARRFTAGTLLVNDLIAPTADPRIPFGGRRGSGYGVTRGAEGLLEMTAARTVQIRRNRATRHFEAVDERHEALFSSLIAVLHGAGAGSRLAALPRLLHVARDLK